MVELDICDDRTIWHVIEKGAIGFVSLDHEEVSLPLTCTYAKGRDLRTYDEGWIPTKGIEHLSEHPRGSGLPMCPCDRDRKLAREKARQCAGATNDLDPLLFGCD